MDNQRLQKLLSLYDSNNPDDFLLFALAKEYENMGELEEALVYYKKLKDHNPEYVGFYYHLAHLYQEFEDWTNAVRTYEEGIAMATKLGDTHALSELKNAKLNMELEQGL